MNPLLATLPWHLAGIGALMLGMPGGAAGAKPATPPYPPSTVVTKLTWDAEVLRIGGGNTGDN
jgi:hypothetical protein